MITRMQSSMQFVKLVVEITLAMATIPEEILVAIPVETLVVEQSRVATTVTAAR